GRTRLREVPPGSEGRGRQQREDREHEPDLAPAAPASALLSDRVALDRAVLTLPDDLVLADDRLLDLGLAERRRDRIAGASHLDALLRRRGVRAHPFLAVVAHFAPLLVCGCGDVAPRPIGYTQARGPPNGRRVRRLLLEPDERREHDVEADECQALEQHGL